MSNLRTLVLTLGLTTAQALYLFAPLLVSAALAALVMHCDIWPGLYRPIDAGCCARGRRLFGDHKTWRGVVIVVAGSVFTVATQKALAVESLTWLCVVDYQAIDPFVFGGSMGMGAALGELPNSFVKRRLAIPPGETAGGAVRRAAFFVWDQVDLLTGAWLFIALTVTANALLVAVSFALVLILHPLVALAGYMLGVRPSAR